MTRWEIEMQHQYELGLIVLCTKHHTVCFIAAIAIYGWKLPPSLAKWVYLVSYQNYNIGHEIWWLSCYSQPTKVPLIKPCEELYDICTAIHIRHFWDITYHRFIISVSNQKPKTKWSKALFFTLIFVVAIRKQKRSCSHFFLGIATKTKKYFGHLVFGGPNDMVNWVVVSKSWKLMRQNCMFNFSSFILSTRELGTSQLAPTSKNHGFFFIKRAYTANMGYMEKSIHSTVNHCNQLSHYIFYI